MQYHDCVLGNALYMSSQVQVPLFLCFDAFRHHDMFQNSLTQAAMQQVARIDEYTHCS